MRTYVHARPEDLAVARDALARKIIREECEKGVQQQATEH